MVTALRNSGDPSTQSVVVAFGVMEYCSRAVDQQGAVGICELICKPNTVEDLCDAVVRFGNAAPTPILLDTNLGLNRV